MPQAPVGPSPRARRPIPPPRPHDPTERELVGQIGPWQVRRFPLSSAKHEYCARRGFLHLQLWHREAGVSVLTPSRLTGDQFDIAGGGTRVVVPAPAALSQVLAAHHIRPPSMARLTALVEWHVRAIERGLARTRPHGAAADRAVGDAPRSATS
jgi:hypothetical protein